jgi:hypothetical protein
MFSEELPDRITSMPTCSVNIQPNSIAAKLAIKVLHHLEESLSVATFSLENSCTAQKRSNPSRNIQTLPMLAGCRDLQTLSDKRPAATKPRMQGKAAFVLKNNGFFRTQRFEFFLGSWQTSLRPRPLLGDRHDWLVSAGTQVDASNTALDGPSVLSRTGAVNESPKWDHPIGHGLNRTSAVIRPNGAPTGLQFSASSWLAVQSAFWGLGLRPLPYLPPVSSGLCSSVFGQGLRQSNWGAALLVPEGGWRSSCRSKLQELFQPKLKAALLMPYEGSKGRYS